VIGGLPTPGPCGRRKSRSPTPLWTHLRTAPPNGGDPPVLADGRKVARDGTGSRCRRNARVTLRLARTGERVSPKARRPAAAIRCGSPAASALLHSHDPAKFERDRLHRDRSVHSASARHRANGETVRVVWPTRSLSASSRDDPVDRPVRCFLDVFRFTQVDQTVALRFRRNLTGKSVAVLFQSVGTGPVPPRQMSSIPSLAAAFLCFKLHACGTLPAFIQSLIVLTGRAILRPRTESIPHPWDHALASGLSTAPSAAFALVSLVSLSSWRCVGFAWVAC
jgi:hypothetical protein